MLPKIYENQQRNHLKNEVEIGPLSSINQKAYAIRKIHKLEVQNEELKVKIIK